MTHLLILLFSLIQYGSAQQTLFPAAIPLVVRSPYLTCWDFTTNEPIIGALWPRISAHRADSTADDVLNVPVHVRVDSITYSFLGNSTRVNSGVNFTNMVISPTQTKLTAQAGPMQFDLTFLNPIEPGDWVKQSIPFSYLSLTANSLDGAAHAVQLYSDISGQWLSGNRNKPIAWNTNIDNDVIYHKVYLRDPTVFNEINAQAEWGTLYYATKSGDRITYKIGPAADTRLLFQLNGALDNQTDQNFRSIGTNLSAFAISRDLGTIQATQDPVVWTVGFTTDPAIQYTDPSADAPQKRSLYYKTQYPGDDDETPLILDFLNDFANASSRAQQLDSKILGDAATVSGQLGDLVSLATAQVYGSIQLTVGVDASGKIDDSDVMAFMKNIGGNTGGANPNRVNAVETLYSAFPAFMYIDPKLGGLLLEPLFRLQASTNYTNTYAATDLGSSYPNVTISNSGHNQRVEQSGNMLIMTYAHARATGDGSLIGRYYYLLTTWADYLSDSTLNNRDQISADGLSTNNQANLAIKGIIAIKAMSEMSTAARRAADADKYSNMAANLYSQWKDLSLASDQHVVATYGLEDSWTSGYNLFPDIWLDTKVVESSVYDSHSNFLNNLTTSTFSNFGLPIDGNNDVINFAASSWTLFAAAMTSNQDLRTNLISRVHNRASFNASVGVFPVSYDGANGATNRGGASPAQGAMYAPLALRVSPLQITANPVTTRPRTSSKSHAGAIAGGVVGAIAGLLAIGAIVIVARRRQRPKPSESSSERNGDPDMAMVVTPFHPPHTGAAELETGLQTNWFQQWTEPSEPEIVPLVHAATPPDSPRVTPIPIGLSDKELAWMRGESLRSRSLDVPQPDPPPASTVDRSVASPSPDAQRLQSEVESLRREMQQLAERIEAPPGYEPA